MIEVTIKLSSKEVSNLNHIMEMKALDCPKAAIRSLINSYKKEQSSSLALLSEYSQLKRESEHSEEILILLKRLADLISKV